MSKPAGEKVDQLRALREARYAETQAQARAINVKPSTVKTSKRKKAPK